MHFFFSTANECTCLLLLHLQSKTSAASEMLYGLIDRQLSLVPQLADFTIISMLKMIAKVGTLCTEEEMSVMD